jgi:hypothetical protein
MLFRNRSYLCDVVANDLLKTMTSASFISRGAGHAGYAFLKRVATPMQWYSCVLVIWPIAGDKVKQT